MPAELTGSEGVAETTKPQCWTEASGAATSEGDYRYYSSCRGRSWRISISLQKLPHSQVGRGPIDSASTSASWSYALACRLPRGAVYASCSIPWLWGVDQLKAPSQNRILDGIELPGPILGLNGNAQALAVI